MRRRVTALCLACLLLAALCLPAAAADGDYQRGYDQGYADALRDDYFELPYPDEYWTNYDYHEGYDAGVEAALDTLPDYQRGYEDGYADALQPDYFDALYPEEYHTNETYAAGYDAGAYDAVKTLPDYRRGYEDGYADALRDDYWSLDYPEEYWTDAVYALGYDEGADAALSLPPVVRYGGRDGAVNVMVNGQCIDFGDDVWPMVTEGRTLAPARAVLEALGAEVEYDPAARTVSARRDGVLLLHTIGTDFVERYPDGDTASEPEILAMDCPSRLVSGRTMVPVRFFADALEVSVLWDEADRTAVLLDPAALAAEWDGQLTVLNGVLDALRLPAEENTRRTTDTDVTITLLDSLNGDVEMEISVGEELLTGPAGMQERLTWDLSGLFDVLRAQGGDAYVEEMAQVLEQSSLELRTDAASGKTYVGGPVIDALAEMSDVWLTVDTEAAAPVGSVTELVLRQTTTWDALSFWTTAEGTLKDLTAVLGDDTFTATGSGWQWNAAAADAAVQSFLDDAFLGFSAASGHTVDLSLTVGRDGTVDFTADVTGFDFTMTAALETGASAGSWSLDLHARNAMKLRVTGGYRVTASETAPETTPPAGEITVDALPDTMV